MLVHVRNAAAMAAIIVLAACGGGTAPAPQGAAPELSDGADSPVIARREIPGQYIVVMDDALVPLVPRLVDLITGAAVELLGWLPIIQGAVVRMDAATAEWLARQPGVAYVEPDQWMQATAVQVGPTWGLDRVDQRPLPLDGQFRYPDAAGAGSHVYIIDTGLRSSHAEFTGRVGGGRNFVATSGGLALPIPLLGDLAGGLLGGLLGGGASADPADFEDCNGHGTHVAGTAVGTTYGIAKGARVYGVRVLDCRGSGATSGVIAGMQWVADNHIKPAVANLSLGGGASTALDDAVRAAIAAGVTVVVAAGNDSTNACNGSPNRVAEAITVGASTREDQRSSFSNTGACVDLFAPGSAITSAWHTGDTQTQRLDGTSMASPHVAGAAAVIAAAGGTPGDVTSALLDAATVGILSGIGNGSPNRLLYVQP